MPAKFPTGKINVSLTASNKNCKVQPFEDNTSSPVKKRPESAKGPVFLILICF